MDANIDSQIGATEKVLSESHKVPVWVFWRARRYLLAMMLFLGFFNSYSLRVNLSVAIVAMTQLNNITSSNGTIYLERYFDWDTKIQGYLLGSFFYGYIFTQIVGGYLCIRFGGKPVIAAGIGVASVLTVLSPIAANINIYLFLTVRILVGVFEGIITPSAHYLHARWYPPLEKTRLVTIGLSGTYFGTVISLPLSSLLASTLGWESIFYVSGLIGIIWTMFFLLIVKNKPSEDSKISKHELTFITESLKVTKPAETSLSVPWRAILSSKHVWAASIGVTCEIWGYYTLLTQLPKFMKYCLNFDLNAAGAVSALPYIAVTIVLQASGHLADYLATRKSFTITQLRKIFIGVGFMGQCLFLVISVYWLSKLGTIFCLIVAVGFGGFAMSAFCVNILDMAPNYGPVITAMANTLATVPGVVSPIITGYLVTDETSVEQWRIIFYITASIYLLGSIIFICFGTGELQPWDNPEIKYKKTDDINGHNNKTFNAEET
ncbi:unnamed protein product [Psylliodes chrysocephalus]|uniref:Sialin n=1 Tax=Psylliodes chrysocephalus TaxID=3402493 RepID=A0A9P0G3M2_9CUCU|nr:unnamed protein product [Psylliodes chrysocephala]